MKRHAGFRINALIGPHTNASWGRLAAEFIAANDQPDKLQPFVNTILAQGWREAAEEVDETGLQARAEPFGLENLPPEVLLMIAGGDIQHDILEITFVGWSRNAALILGHAVVWGSLETTRLGWK